jgi:hypothetical protein
MASVSIKVPGEGGKIEAKALRTHKAALAEMDAHSCSYLQRIGAWFHNAGGSKSDVTLGEIKCGSHLKSNLPYGA